MYSEAGIRCLHYHSFSQNGIEWRLGNPSRTDTKEKVLHGRISPGNRNKNIVRAKPTHFQ